ncbi:DUF6970 domain-containing protein [Lysobacter tyrosinilyticus]
MQLTKTLATSLVLAVLVAGCDTATKGSYEADAPAWLRIKLLAASNGSGELPASVWRVKLGGRDAYYFSSDCCDAFNELYAADGKHICSPDGGMTGDGDGRCPVGLGKPDSSELIWSKSPEYRAPKPTW